MSVVLYEWLASWSNELTQLVEETIPSRLNPSEKRAFEQSISSLRDLVIEPILNHKEEETLLRTFREMVPVFWSHVISINYLLLRHYEEVSENSGIELLENDERRFVRYMLKAIRSAKGIVGVRETGTMLRAVRTLWRYDSLILSSLIKQPQKTEQAVLSLNLKDLQETVGSVCLPILLALVIINERPIDAIGLRNVKNLTVPLTEYAKELSDCIETLDILLSQSSMELNKLADEDLKNQRFYDLNELVKGR